MTCDEVRQLLPGYLTGALDAAESAAVRAHLAGGCPACQAALAETQVVLAHLPDGLEPITPNPATFDHLLSRIKSVPPLAAPPVRRASPLRYAIAASIGLLIGLGVAFLLVSQSSDRAHQLELALADRNSHIADLNHLLSSDQLHLVELAGQEPTGPHGHILYNPAANQWRVYVFDLKPPAPGRVYELWAITPDQRKLPAGTFTVDAAGSAIYSGQVPQGPVALAAITDEPIGGSSQPTGSIHLAGPVAVTR
ncbi:MAG TPA: anti-sigma factor [Tepidisphaeraceae bacterium]|nr:anti-sigma factor [Tepidisphaeraceae bacterium]